MSHTVSLPLAHFASLTAVAAEVGAPPALGGAAAEVGAVAPEVGAEAAEVVAAAAELVVAALVVLPALFELELLPHADTVKATAMPTDAT